MPPAFASTTDPLLPHLRLEPANRGWDVVPVGPNGVGALLLRNNLNWMGQGRVGSQGPGRGI